MDELKIKSKFMNTIVSKLISMAIRKKFGYKIDLQINDVEVTVVEDKAHVHLNADAEIDTNEFKKFTRIIGLED